MWDFPFFLLGREKWRRKVAMGSKMKGRHLQVMWKVVVVGWARNVT